MNKWKIQLNDNKGFQWQDFSSGRVRGYAYYGDTFIQGQSFATFLDCNIKNESDFSNVISKLNGAFLVVYETTSRIFLATDIVQAGGTLFYDTSIGLITDKLLLDLSSEESNWDKIAIAENIKSLLYTVDNRTYSKTVKHLTAGEIVEINKDDASIKRNFYYQHIEPGNNDKLSKSDYLKEIDNLSIRVFQRLISSLNGKTAIIPLSGGYDSRYIAVMLKKLGYENVVCYTYGYSEETNETGVSSKVAKALGYKHFYVNEDEKFWSDFLENTDVEDFLEYGNDWCHTPHIQEIKALAKLRTLPEFPQNGVIIPGFSGDLFGGSYSFNIEQNKDHKYDMEELCEYIFTNHFTSFSNLKQYDSVIINDLENFFNLRGIHPFNLQTFEAAFEYWFCSHKIAKYINPSVKAYELFDYEFRLPLWDKELTDYWYNIPQKYKQKDPLYTTSLQKLYFEPANVAFVKRDSARLQIEKYHRKLHNVIGYSILLRIYYGTGLLLLPRDSNNFIYVLKMIYGKVQNKSLIRPLENRWLEPLVIWWLEYILRKNKLYTIFNNSI